MRRILAVAALAALLSPSVAPFASADSAHACTSHVCYCRPAAAPKPAAGSCHASRPAAPATTLRAACDHGQETFTPGAAVKVTLPSAWALAVVPDVRSLSAPAPKGVREWAVPPETPPPRALSC
jgi:hypothetical protein